MRRVAQPVIRLVVGLTIAFGCALLAACGGGGGAPGPTAPSALSYPNPIVFVVGSAIAAVTPGVTGAVTTYEVTPALPSGVSFDPTTGRISGTPTAVSAEATYTIAASNSVGRTTFALRMTVNPAAPTALSYAHPPRLFAGLPIELAATVTGVVDSYSVTPALPNGLSLDATSGRIEGTPTTAGPSVVYTVTARNVTGQTSGVLPMAVTAFVIEATADVAGVEIDWATGSNASYDLLRSEAPGCDPDNYTACPGGTLITGVSPPFRAEALENGKSYWFRLDARTSAVIRSNEAGARPDQLTAQQVKAIAIGADGTAYLGGDFRSVGVRTGSGVALDRTTGRPGAFPYVDGIVYAAIEDGAGGWYIGGDFLSVGGLPRHRLARVRADMSVDPWSPSVGEARHHSGVVQSLALLGGMLYVGGTYHSVNGAPRNGLAAVAAGDGSLSATFNPVFDLPFVVSVAAAGSTVYVGGDFSTVNGEPRARLAAFDAASGSLLDLWNPGANGVVSDLAVADDVVYVGGTFTSLGGEARSNLAAVGTDGALRSWNPAPNAWVSSVAVADEVVYVAGGFTDIAGGQRLSLAAVGTDGVLRAWNPGQGYATGVAVADDTVYVAGQFTFVGAAPRAGLAAVGTDGTTRAWNPAPDGWPLALAVSADKVYVGGHISHYRGTARNRLAAIRADGTLADWAPEANDGVNALAVAGDTVFAGGRFTSVRGSNENSAQPRNRLAALAADGTLSGWNPNADGAVNALVVHGDTVYVGGEFASIGNVPRARAAALSSAGVLSSAWNPSPDAMVRALAVADDAVFVAGDFLQLGGEARARIGLVGFDGVLRGFSVGFDQPIWAVAAANNVVYVGGQFVGAQSSLPLPRQGLAAFDLNGTLLGWNPGMLGLVHAVHVADGVVYFAGAFAEILGQPRRSVAALGVDGVLRDWHANDVNQSAVGLTSRAGAVHVAGHYTVLPAAP